MSVASSNPFSLLTDTSNEEQVANAAAKQGKKTQAKAAAAPVAIPSERARPSERTIKSGYPSR
ncbi:hypothetical protein LPJ57_003205, partial [Coemansia sp. RSA 486]